MTINYICEGAGATSDCTPATDFNFEAVEGSADAGGAHTSSVTVNTPTPEITHSWTTLADNPNSADWPSGDYTFQIRIGTLQITSYQGEIHRRGITCAAIQTLGTSSAQTSTGTFTYTVNTDPTGGSASDRFQGQCLALNAETMTKNFRVNTNVADPDGMYLEGPWTAAGPARNRVMVVG